MRAEIEKLIKKIRIEAVEAGVGIEDFVDAQDINYSTICLDGNWTTYPGVWGLCEKDGEWIFFQTDDERGYICGIRRYDTLEEAVKEIYENYKIHIKARAQKLGVKSEKYPEDIIDLLERFVELGMRTIVNHFVDAWDIDLEHNMLLVDEKWIKNPSSWGFCWKKCKWVYFETDDEGKIVRTKEFEDEEVACKAVYRKMRKLISEGKIIM